MGGKASKSTIQDMSTFGGAVDQTAATENNNIINISKGDHSSMAMVKDHSYSAIGQGP